MLRARGRVYGGVDAWSVIFVWMFRLMPYLFDFRDFEFVHGVFELPENIFIFRAVDPTAPMLPNIPTFYGDYEVAQFYSKERRLTAYEPKRKIRVLDLRYVQAILPQLWRVTGTNTKSEEEVIYKSSLCFGLTSFRRQIELLEGNGLTQVERILQRMKAFMELPVKPAWVNPIEMQGVRCSITEYDYQVMNFLKLVFGDIVDGIIAPALPTPSHDQIHEHIDKSMMYQELVIFDPSSCLKEIVSSQPTFRLSFEGRISAQYYVANLMRVPQRTAETTVTRRSIMLGGKSNTKKTKEAEANEVDVRDAMGERISNGDAVAIKKLNAFMKGAKKMATKIKRSQVYLRYYCPNICMIGSPIPGVLKMD